MVDGRAAMGRIAEVLGVSDQTVIRRYRRMRGSGVLRVVGLPRGYRVGLYESWLRVRCTPQAAAGVAEALARRPDIAWVTLTAGGTEVHCVTRARTLEERDTLLLRHLPRTRQVIDVSAHTVLRTFTHGPKHNELEVLDPAQIGALAPPAAEPTDGVVSLDVQDSDLLDLLRHEGRSTYTELARATGRSEAAVRRRIEYLRRSGALYFDVEIHPAWWGPHTQAALLLTVAPGALPAVGAALGTHGEVRFAAAITGVTNVVTTAVFRDTDALYRYLTERIGALPGVQNAEVLPALRSVKRAGMLVQGDRLVDPPV